jgi:hypothetical protein
MGKPTAGDGNGPENRRVRKGLAGSIRAPSARHPAGRRRIILRVKVEGAAAGYYVAALFESARPEHRGLNTARLVRDARCRSRAALARLRLARYTARSSPILRTVRVAPAFRRARRTLPRVAQRVRGKPRPRGAA